MKCICGYEQLTDFEQFIGGLYLCPKCGTLKAKTADDEVVSPDLLHKEMKCYCITGTHKHPENGYTIKLYNGDNPRNPDESASIKMTPERFERFVQNLCLWLPKEEKPHIKELNTWSISGNVYRPENGIRLSLYNEDEKGNTTDDVVIKLKPKEAKSLCKSLQHYLPKEEREPDPTFRFHLIVSMSMTAARMIDAGEIECGPGRLCEFINNIVDKYLSDFANTLKFDNYAEMTLRANFGVKTKSACPCDTCKSVMEYSEPINCTTACDTFWDWIKCYGHR